MAGKVTVGLVAAHHRVHDHACCHLQADCLDYGISSAPPPTLDYDYGHRPRKVFESGGSDCGDDERGVLALPRTAKGRAEVSAGWGRTLPQWGSGWYYPRKIFGNFM